MLLLLSWQFYINIEGFVYLLLQRITTYKIYDLHLAGELPQFLTD